MSSSTDPLLPYSTDTGTHVPHSTFGSICLLLLFFWLWHVSSGFNISLDPRFSVTWMTWVEKYRGVLAVPNIRGGGEYGEAWHDGGIKENKTNSFDDFLAAADHLINKKYTSEGKIILNGGSNGGMLVAACTNRAREGLIGASVADVGVLDLLKFHKWTMYVQWLLHVDSLDLTACSP